MGNAYKGIGRFDDAERYYENAVRRARASQHPPRSALAYVKNATFSRENARYLDTEAAALGNIGQIQASRGSLTKAEEYLRQSLEIYTGLSQKLGQDERGQANQLLSLGMVFLSQGRFQLAEENLKEAARLFRRIGDSKLLALTESARARLSALF